MAQPLCACEERAVSREVTISRPDFEATLQHLRRIYPLEGCGMWSGRGAAVQAIHPVDNILQSATAFEMEPRQQIETLLAIAAAGRDLIAIYHSHPHGPQVPSPTDIARAYYPEALQVIVSLADRERPAVRAFQIGDGLIREAKIRIV